MLTAPEGKWQWRRKDGHKNIQRQTGWAWWHTGCGRTGRLQDDPCFLQEEPLRATKGATRRAGRKPGAWNGSGAEGSRVSGQREVSTRSRGIKSTEQKGWLLACYVSQALVSFLHTVLVMTSRLSWVDKKKWKSENLQFTTLSRSLVIKGNRWRR